MNKSTSSNQSNKTNQKNKQQRNSDQSVVASDQAQPMVPTRASGSALQDVQPEARANQPNGAPTEHPIATNYADADSPGDSKTSTASTANGPFETEQAPADQEGRVNLHNNPDLPDDESVQGKLPDTNPISRPIDNSTNLPD